MAVPCTHALRILVALALGGRCGVLPLVLSGARSHLSITASRGARRTPPLAVVDATTVAERWRAKEHAACRVFVGGIPFGMREADVARIFDGVALPHEVKPVVEVTFMLRADGSPKGYGFVQLATSVMARRATTLLDGRAVTHGGRTRPLVVRASNNTASNGSTSRSLAVPAAGRVLWVGNISWSATPIAVRDAFAAAAEVPVQSVWCSLPRDMAGRLTGFGTVRFADADAASVALHRMAGTSLLGRSLIVRIDERVGPAPARPNARGARGTRPTLGPTAASVAGIDGVDAAVAATAEAHLLAEEREARRVEQISRHTRYLAAAAAAEKTAQQGAGSRTDATGRARKSRRRPQKSDSPSCFVVVSNLPFDARASALRRALRERLCAVLLEGPSHADTATGSDAAAGNRSKPRRIWVKFDRFGRSAGFGLVWARSARDALAVLKALDGFEVNGRPVVCSFNQTSATSFPTLRPISWLRRLEALDGDVTQTPHAYGRAW